ncbi:hypothetical protein AAHX73_15895 [Klebsiella pneumoniae]|uniref:hypothetical protein n=1 Tax=Klebsiella pneumoniae TaxID=573 RepID=UPI000CEBEC14|nr:hypothetical protein [Klebsiella pneumoniae]QOU39653.1 hypothetical protein GJJ12_015595 [Klebsiella pneumoniae]ROG23939.1 hypothetical protein C4Y62_008550 [Klebsiella pneumoniae subsp. pneumoniae]
MRDLILQLSKSSIYSTKPELLATGQHPKIELDFDVAADDFFKIATEFGDIGARITRVNERFIIKIKPPKA